MFIMLSFSMDSFRVVFFLGRGIAVCFFFLIKVANLLIISVVVGLSALVLLLALNLGAITLKYATKPT